MTLSFTSHCLINTFAAAIIHSQNCQIQNTYPTQHQNQRQLQSQPEQQLDMRFRLIFLQTVLLALLTLPTSATTGIDISPLFTTQATFDCLKGGNYKFANVRAFSIEGADFDLSVKDTLIYAQRAGFKTDLFIRPCRGKSAKLQIDEVMLAVAYQYFDKFWLYLFDNPNFGCKWGINYKANCDWVKEMVAQVKNLYKQPGIYSNPQFWKKAFGGASACPELAQLPLIYSHDDLLPKFDDFVAFGGWTEPFGKVYHNNVSACNINLNRVYEEDNGNLQLQ